MFLVEIGKDHAPYPETGVLVALRDLLDMSFDVWLFFEFCRLNLNQRVLSITYQFSFLLAVLSLVGFELLFPGLESL